jgi:hypothetical protein
VFQRYAALYFDQALTSVYFFDTDYDGFGACFLVKKRKINPFQTKMDIGIEGDKGIKEGSWDSIHVVTVSLEQN